MESTSRDLNLRLVLEIKVYIINVIYIRDTSKTPHFYIQNNKVKENMFFNMVESNKVMFAQLF